MSTVLPPIRPQLICKSPIADSADLMDINRLCDNPTPDIERVLSLLQRYDDALLESQQEREALRVDVVEFLNLLMLFRKFFFDNISDAIDADLIECYSLDNSTWFFHINLCEFVSAEECADLNDKWQDIMIDWMYADKLTRRSVLDHVSVHFSYS